MAELLPLKMYTYSMKDFENAFKWAFLALISTVCLAEKVCPCIY